METIWEGPAPVETIWEGPAPAGMEWEGPAPAGTVVNDYGICFKLSALRKFNFRIAVGIQLQVEVFFAVFGGENAATASQIAVG